MAEDADLGVGERVVVDPALGVGEHRHLALLQVVRVERLVKRAWCRAALA